MQMPLCGVSTAPNRFLTSLLARRGKQSRGAPRPNPNPNPNPAVRPPKSRRIASFWFFFLFLERSRIVPSRSLGRWESIRTMLAYCFNRAGHDCFGR
jgi:hypothetical protein